ncbi:hypothetical protein OG585_16455 [Streptomyces sp. NBC_01340]|nr:hypothetical protein OG585_16455 [Streptomyces sp. NBC_01340]
MKYLMYGMQSTTMSEVASVVGRALRINFEARDSSYKGGLYYRYGHEGEWDMSIESHWRDEDGVLAKPDFPEFSVLVYVNEAPLEVEDEMDRIPGLRKLQSRTFQGG